MPTTFLTDPVSNEEAVEFIRNKPTVTREVFEKLLPELRARAFTITGLENATAMQNVRDLIADLPRGGDWDTLKRQIASQMSPFLVDDTADTDTQDRQQLGAERRAELLLRMHGFQAYSAAAHRCLEEQRDVFPYCQYKSMGDGSVRATHRALHDIILPADDPFWHGHTGPWEWGCRCQKVGLMEIDVDEIREADKDKPLEQRRLIEGEARAQLVEKGRLVKGPNEIYDVRTPAQRGVPGAFSWNPGDLRLSIEDLRGRYDTDVWNSFETWAKATPIEELNLTVYEWLSGNRIVAPTAKIALPPTPIQTISQAFAHLDLDKKVTWEESDVLRLRGILAKSDKVAATDKILSITGNGLQKKGPGSAVWIRQQMDEIIGMLPRAVAEALPKITLRIDRGIGGAYGEYNPVTKEIALAYATIMKSPDGVNQLHETLWHETMHWIHMAGPDSYRKAIQNHFRERTKGEPLAPMVMFGGMGRRDKWWNEYAGKQYVGTPFDREELGAGLEVPTRYFQLMANPTKLIRQLDPQFQANADVFLDTLKVVLGIFTGEYK